MDKVLDCQHNRRFGVEIELNTANGVIRKLDEDEGEIPYGAEKVAVAVKRATRDLVEIHGWHATHNNTKWIVKPDSSCGIEVCTPILKGWLGLSDLLKVIEEFRRCGLSADNRCSMHVHINIADLTKRQLASVIAYYIKCEHLIFDAFPYGRKNNRYCEFMGTCENFNRYILMQSDEIIARAGSTKYYSANVYQFMKGGGFTWKNNRKQTMEFRTGEAAMCLDPFIAKNWIRFIIHFVEMTKNLPLPKDYCEGDRWTGLLWLDPEDMFKILKFHEPMSAGLTQVRDWVIDRIMLYGRDYNRPETSIWSIAGRDHARSKYEEIFKSCGPKAMSYDDLVFGKKYIV